MIKTEGDMEQLMIDAFYAGELRSWKPLVLSVSFEEYLTIRTMSFCDPDRDEIKIGEFRVSFSVKESHE